MRGTTISSNNQEVGIQFERKLLAGKYEEAGVIRTANPDLTKEFDVISERIGRKSA